MICPNCGRRNPSGATFCSRCRQRLPLAARYTGQRRTILAEPSGGGGGGALVLGVALLAGFLFIGGGAAIYLSQPQPAAPTDVANLPSAGRSLDVFVQETPTPLPTPVPSPTPLPTFDPFASPTFDPFASPTFDPFATPTPNPLATPTPVETEARFVWDQRQGLRVAFSDRSVGTIFGWSWDFGDGQFSTERSPRHDYGAPGEYRVVLTVTGPDGAVTRGRNITVINPNPTPTPTPATQARFSANQQSGTLNVQFNDNSTGSPTSWSWNFGDGAASTQRNPDHEYAQPGNYDVTLTVNGPGGTASLTKQVTVEPVGPPPPNAQFLCVSNVDYEVTCVAELGGGGTQYAWSSTDGGSPDGGVNNKQVTFSYPKSMTEADNPARITLVVTVDGVSNERTTRIDVQLPGSPPPEE